MTSPAAPRPPGKHRISFGDTDNPANLVGALDPFARTELKAGERIHSCGRCKLGYHEETWQFLRANNAGNCVNCRRSDRFVVIVLPGALEPGRVNVPAPPRADEAIVRLDQIPGSVGRVVLFEGEVLKTHRSQGGTWFLKFEDTPLPFEGFTINIFPDYVDTWIEAGINPKLVYETHDVRVRGLVREHPTYGLQMIVTHPNMIMVVDPVKPRPGILWKAE